MATRGVMGKRPKSPRAARDAGESAGPAGPAEEGRTGEVARKIGAGFPTETERFGLTDRLGTGCETVSAGKFPKRIQALPQRRID
jgi:hypothetical protein